MMAGGSVGSSLLGPPIRTAVADPAVRAFVDLSNIWYGIADAAAEHGESGLPVRLYADNIASLLRAGRADFGALVVANADVPDPVLNRFQRVANVISRESGKLTGTEQANDETLQVRMYETMHDNPPGVLVLATGDGAGWRQRRGFLPVLEAARRHKWGIEVVAWGGSTNEALKAWVQRAGEVFIDLDDFYAAVTFVQGGRVARPLSLRHRRTASVRNSSERG